MPGRASEVPEHDGEDEQVHDQVVGDDRMHEVGLAERRRICVADAPGKSGACDRVVLAVDDVPDPADGLAEDDPDDRGCRT